MFGLLDNDSVWSVLARLGVALVLALPIAWERERRTRLMGLRTFPIVAMASCGYIILALAAVGESVEAQARVIQGLITGMGFIGGGAILKKKGTVEGTATAASLWATSAMGMAVAYRQMDIAIAISIIVFLVLQIMTPIEERVLGKASEGEADE